MHRSTQEMPSTPSTGTYATRDLGWDEPTPE
jgi:hypothetical protein